MTDKIIDILIDFINCDERRVCLVKGKWGVGKTYIWKVIQNDLFEKLKYDTLSYVSFFGVSTLQDIKNQIFFNAKRVQYVGARNLFKNTYKVAASSKYANELTNLNKEWEYRSLNNYLICFDDIERRNPSLRMADILGIISDLTADKNCKVIIILNENQLSSDDADELTTYREKILDLELEYNPGIINNASIVFGRDCDQIYLDMFEKLGLNNIRILKLASYAIEHFKPFIDKYEQSIRYEILRHIIIIVTIYYDKSIGINISDIKILPYTSLLEKSGKNTEQSKIAHKMGYIYVEYDKHVVDFLKTGQCDISDFCSYTNALNEREKKSQIRNKLYEVYEIYRGNFKNNMNELASKLISFIHEHKYDIYLDEYDQMIEFCKGIELDLQLPDTRDECIRYTAENTENTDLLHQLLCKTTNSEIIEAINLKLSAQNTIANMKSIIYKISDRKSWNRKDFEVLNSFSVQEIYDWLINEETHDLLATLSSFIDIANPTVSDDNQKSFGIKLFDALAKIAAIDAYNKSRVEKLLNISRYRASD